jgi:hypothetical protein
VDGNEACLKALEEVERVCLKKGKRWKKPLLARENIHFTSRLLGELARGMKRGIPC